MTALEESTIEELFKEIQGRVHCAVLVLDTEFAQEATACRMKMMTSSKATTINALGLLEAGASIIKASLERE